MRWDASCKDFKTAAQENVFEVSAMVYREPYGVTLIICPFNGPLVLSLRPAVALYRPATPAS